MLNMTGARFPHTAVSLVAICSVVLASLVAVGAGRAEAAGCRPFPDVSSDNVFCGEIAWFKAQGIANGYEDGAFHASAFVSRQVMAAFLFRLVNPDKQAEACTAEPFPDVSSDNVFCGEIAWFKAQGIANGYEDGAFHASAFVSRQVMAAFLHRIVNLLDSTPAGDDDASENGSDSSAGDNGPAVVGEAWEWSNFGELALRVTLEDVDRFSHQQGAWNGDPEHEYLVATVKIEAFSGLKKTNYGFVYLSPYDWSVELPNGRPFKAIQVGSKGYIDEAYRVPYLDKLYPGESFEGKMLFDAPSHGELVYRQFFYRAPYDTAHLELRWKLSPDQRAG